MRAVFYIRDTFMGNGVRTQVGRRAIFVKTRSLLQALEKFGHSLRVKPSADQYVQSDTIGFFFMVAGEIELRLNQGGLGANKNSLRRLGIRTRRQHGQR